MKKIVVTDGATLNPGDLEWTSIMDFGQLDYFDTTPEHLASIRCASAEIIITNKTIISREVIRSAPKLKMIAVTATGYNNIDLMAAKEAGVIVCNVPEYGTYSVAQHTFALLLEMVNHVSVNAASTTNNGWAASGQWSYTKKRITELKGKTFGIVGFGRIGQQSAAFAAAFGMNVIFNNRSRKAHAYAKQVELEDLFSQSDVVSLHCPLTTDNKEFVDLLLLSKMKPDAMLINTSRGPLINEQDLVSALDQGLLARAALDVLSEEPPGRDHPLANHKKCLVTPHTAWISFEARQRLMKETINNIACFLTGKPIHVVG